MTEMLGLELGAGWVRGALLSASATGELGIRRLAECPIVSPLKSEPGSVHDLTLVSPAVDEVLAQLGVDRDTRPPVGLSIGPSHSGVGSGPALAAWLREQANLLTESIVYAGNLGVAFSPQSAVDSAVHTAHAAELNLKRIDLAPVAAARVLDMEAVDTIVVGSGRGWQARLRDGEVLEALEVGAVKGDSPLRIVAADGDEEAIENYHLCNVVISLNGSAAPDGVERIGRFATAAGAALGIHHESPADLLHGDLIERSNPREALNTPTSTELSTPWGQRVEGKGARTTLDLQRHLSPVGEPHAYAGPDTTLDDPLGTGAPVAEGDPITQFSPDTDINQEMAKSTRLRAIMFVLFVALILATAAAVYWYLTR